MQEDWIEKIVDAFKDGLITSSEAGYGVLHELATAPRFDGAALREVDGLFARLPAEVRAPLVEASGRIAATGGFSFRITTVGGKGLASDPENVRDVCALLGLLGPEEMGRVRARMA